MSIADLIRKSALDMGFSSLRFIKAQTLLEAETKFLEWRDRGYAADMHYLLRDNPINARPEQLLLNAKSIIMLSAAYYTPAPPSPGPDWGRVASYAVGQDYHKVLKRKVLELIRKPELENIFRHSRFFTDAVPLLEKSFAAEAGLGFQGRNTLLISRSTGSYNFILEIITDLEIEELENNPPPDIANCGACSRCLDICPTQALSLHGDLKQQHNGILDSRRCISYLTIENRGEIPEELQSKLAGWVFGCDLCQEVCPYNQKDFHKINEVAKSRIFKEFWPESGVGHWLHLPSILEIKDEDEFRSRFAGTPLMRAGLKGLQRNARAILRACAKSPVC